MGNGVSSSVAILGAGPGVAAAHELLKGGWAVDIYERDDRIGGMSAATEFDGLKIERYYHFICAPDETLFEYLRELGIATLALGRHADGLLLQRQALRVGQPARASQVPGPRLLTKLRYGAHVLCDQGISDWSGSTRWRLRRG